MFVSIKVTFITTDGKRLTGFGKQGDSLLDVIINNDIDLDGFGMSWMACLTRVDTNVIQYAIIYLGACEGTLACSTCHLIFKNEDFRRLSNKATDEELDMLDLAYDLCDTYGICLDITEYYIFKLSIVSL